MRRIGGRRGLRAVSITYLLLVSSSCTPVGPSGDGQTSDAAWRAAFDTEGVGALSSVWGSGPNDVFVVGGTPGRGEVYHYDGQIWREMPAPSVPLLVWVFGFSDRDVYAVGEDGGAIRYDGDSWSLLDTGTGEDLWGIWGASPNDLWVVGGDVGEDEPVILHFDGTGFSSIPIPANDRAATSLFKVWGIGAKVFAVGEKGLILQFEGGRWFQVPAGAAADDDFVSLWGTSEDNIVAVGGRGSARIARYDGSVWTTTLLTGVPGLNAVNVVDPETAIVGGTNGYAGRYDVMTGALVREATFTNQCIHATWGDGEGTFYAVGGRFSTPYTGLALMRAVSGAGDGDPVLPPLRQCTIHGDCRVGEACRNQVCESVRCSNDDDCTNGEMCEDGACILRPACESDAVCGAGKACQAGACVPVGDDRCTSEPDCPLGQRCDGGSCIATGGPDIQYWAAAGGSAGPVAEGGVMSVHAGFQGGFHTFVTIRAVGFAPNTEANLSVGIAFADGGGNVATPRTLTILFTEIEPGMNEVTDILVRFDELAGGFNGRPAVLSATVSDAGDESTVASLVQEVELILVGSP